MHVICTVSHKKGVTCITSRTAVAYRGGMFSVQSVYGWIVFGCGTVDVYQHDSF